MAQIVAEESPDEGNRPPILEIDTEATAGLKTEKLTTGELRCRNAEKSDYDNFLLSLVPSKVFASLASFAREAITESYGSAELRLPLSSMSRFRNFCRNSL